MSETGKVPFGQKVAFGIGMFANQMFPAVLGIFIVVLVQDLGFPGWMWGVISLVPRIFDSITDPIMGFISDNTKSKWGRRRQYVLIGSVIMGLAFIIMWQLYRENSVDYNFTYFLLWSLVFYLGLTIFSVPYVAMGYEMSNDFHERTSIMAIAQWIGQWAWVIAPWFWVIMYDNLWFPMADVAVRELAVWVGLVCMVFAMVPAIFLPSKSTLNEDYSPLTMKNIGGSLSEIFLGFKEAFQSVPFRKLCFATFFIFNAFNTVASFSFFIIVYYLFAGNAGDAGIWPTLFGSVGALVTTFLVIPIVAKMSKTLGKKKAFLVSQGISVLGYILLWFLFIPGKPYMFLFALPFYSFGIGSLFTLMMSMTADVIDLDELNTGKRREGIFGAIYWWMVKFGLGIAGGLSGLILSVVGFTSGVAEQPEGAIDGLRLFFTGFPIAGTLIAMYVMRDYDISEERANEIRADLDKKKSQPKLGSGLYSSGKLLTLADLDLNKKSGVDFSRMDETELRKLHFKTLKTGVHGLCFSPYTEGQGTGDTLSEEQIRRRMGIIAPHTKWVRSFSCTGGNELIPQIANENGLKTLVGVWISDDKERNQREIDQLVKLANEGLVDMVSVGNEVLLRGELVEHELVGYIDKVRQLIPKSIPIGYAEAYFQFIERPNLVNACDVIFANCYPFWEGASNETSLAFMEKMYALTKEKANGKQVIITETGWPSKGEDIELAQPSNINAMKYFINTQTWTQNENISLFYFSSFDESWKKKDEGELGARWGLWNTNENQKFKL